MLSIASTLKLVIYPTFLSKIPGLSIYIHINENQFSITAGSFDNQNDTHNRVYLEIWDKNDQGLVKIHSSVKNSKKITLYHELFDRGDYELKRKMFLMKAKNKKDLIEKMFPNIEDLRPLMKEINLIVKEYNEGVIDPSIAINRFCNIIKDQYEKDSHSKIEQTIIKATPYKLCHKESSFFSKMRYCIKIINNSINYKLFLFLKFLFNKH